LASKAVEFGDNLSRTVSELSQLIVHIFDPTFLSELFSVGVTADELQAKMDRKSTFWKRVGQHVPNFYAEV